MNDITSILYRILIKMNASIMSGTMDMQSCQSNIREFFNIFYSILEFKSVIGKTKTTVVIISISIFGRHF